MNDDGKVEIKVPDIYRQVDSSVWDELETYLYRSFLTSPSVLGGMNVIFKTLNHHEIQNINLHRPVLGSSEEVQRNYRSAMIAYSTFMIDGENVLPNRASNLRKLMNLFDKLDNSIMEKIIQNLSLLNKRATFLFPLTEVYIHENRSRFKWLHIKQTNINSPTVTGIPGTDVIGMNYCQQTWTSLNHLQDMKEEIERDWNNAKFVGSCFNSKGVRSLEEKDRGRREKERQDSDDLKIKVLYRYLNRDERGNSIEPDDVMTLPDGRKVTVEKREIAQTVDELARQLSSSLSGEKDKHDEIIEKALQQIKEKRENADRERVNLYKAEPDPNDENTISSVLQGGREEANNRFMRIQKMRMENNRQTFLKMAPEMDDGSSIDPK